MADIKLRIEVNPDAETETLGEIATSEEVSNTSFAVDETGTYTNLPTTKIDGANRLSLASGYLTFNNDGYLSNADDSSSAGVLGDEQNPDEFVWGAVPDTKEFHITLTFTQATSLKDIVIYGDSAANQFPTQAIIDGTTIIYSDDAKWAISMPTESDTHTIEFTHWNRANYNAVITSITVMLRYFDIDRFNGLKSVESLTQITAQPNNIWYGTLTNSGSAEIFDIDGEISDMINDGIIPKQNVSIDIIANGRQVQHHIVTDESYSNGTFTFSLENEINNFDNIKVSEITADTSSRSLSVSNYYITDNVLSLHPSIYYMFQWLLSINGIYPENSIGSEIMSNSDNVTIANFLSKISLLNFKLPEDSTLKSIIDDICHICQCSFVQRDNGDYRLIDNKPYIISAPIIIPANMQFTYPSKVLLKNTIYDKITFSEAQNIRTDKVLRYLKNGETFDSADATKNAAIESSVWYSDYYTSQENLDQDETIEQEVYGEWTICKKNISFEEYTRIGLGSLISLYSAKYYESDDSKGIIIYTSSSANILLWTTLASTDMDLFKARLSNVPDNIDLYTGFIFPVNTVVAQAMFTTDNTYIDSIDVIFAYRTANTTFPLQVFIVSGIGTNGKTIQISELSQSNKDISYDNGSSSSELSFGENMFISDSITYNGSKLSSYIANYILGAYKNGIFTTNITVACSDYYDTNGEKRKDWKNGDIFELGDIVRIDKDNLNNSFYKYVDGQDMYFKVTGRKFRYSGVPLVDLELQEAKIYEKYSDHKSFAEDSWYLINEIAQDGVAEEFYSVGDEKTIELSTGEEVTLVILGFNHDELSNGNGLAGITIGMKNLLATTYPMNSSYTNVGGWDSSVMRSSTMATLLSQLPADLQAVIKAVNKKSTNGGGSSSTPVTATTTSSDKLWLLAFAEIFSKTSIEGSSTSSVKNNAAGYEAEGEQYDYYKNLIGDNNGGTDTNAALIKYLSNGEGSAYSWWLRSPNVTNPTTFWYISSYGSADYIYASWTYGVSFGFCV